MTKPRTAVDKAYPVVKKLFASGGIMSQFVNFKNCNHDSLRDERDERKSTMILEGVSRQILSKSGVVMWWSSVPASLPLPAVYMGVDVFHAPRAYDAKTQRRVAKPSVAAIVVQVLRDRNSTQMECYSETFVRGMGEEYNLGAPIEQTLKNALKHLKVKTKPASCVVWRDGVGDTAIAATAEQELPGIRKALGGKAAVAMMICQKRIATKFFHQQGQNPISGMPSGLLVQGVSDLKYPTFYLNGKAPPFSTPKPVRYLIAQRDEGLNNTSMVDLTWECCHTYPNWTGVIKVPAVCQLAHLLAEHAGNFDDSGASIDHAKFANRLYFL